MTRLSLMLLTSVALTVQADDKEAMLTFLENSQSRFGAVTMDIWDYPELGYLETRSTELLQRVLISEGFEIQSFEKGEERFLEPLVDF